MTKRKKEKLKPKPTDAKPTSFKIRMGLPHMEALWKHFTAPNANLTKIETTLYKKLGKALAFLSADPHYPSLNSHEIDSLTKKYGRKIFESYLENNTPSAGRVFWCYGKARGEIIVLALEPHPEPGEYGRVKLDQEPTG